MKISALVPVKNLDTAKSRLADVLSRNERRMLADLMLSDVLEVILKTPKIEKVFLAITSISKKKYESNIKKNE